MNEKRTGCLFAFVFAAVLIAALVTMGTRVHGAEVNEMDHHLAGIDENLVLNLPEPEPEIEEDPLVSLGTFKITYYCCEKYPHICGTGDGITATGVEIEPGMIAVDPKIIPYGSVVIIDGEEYTATDCGRAIKGYRIDIAVPTHAEAVERGIDYKEVWEYVSRD